jgi:hypothetical protein
MADRGRDWRSILLGIGGLACALFAFGLAGLMIIFSAFGVFRGDLSQNDPTTFQAVVVASGLILTSAVFLPASYYSLQRLRGVIIPGAAPKLLNPWQAVLLLLLWAGSAWLAQGLIGNEIFKWFTPPLYLLAIGTPVYFLFRLTAGGLDAGSRQRLWGIPAASIALGTTLSILAEGTLVLIGLVGGVVYLGLHPEQLTFFKQIASQLTDASSIDSVMSKVEPLLNNPIIFLLALSFFSGFTPIIEETAKSIAPWTVFDHLASPAQGFVIGALSGAGFGLVESLLASATPDSSWALTLMIRGGSTMMHILTASFTGWGIASYHANKSLGRLIGAYASAIFLHGLWNAAVIMIVYGGLQMSSIGGSPNALGVILLIFGISVLALMCLAIPLTLGLINRRLRKNSALSITRTAGELLGEVGQQPGSGTEGVK